LQPRSEGLVPENHNNQIASLGRGESSGGILDLFVGPGKRLELPAEDRIVNLRNQRVHALLNVLDSVADRHGQHALHQRPTLERSGEEQIENTTHDGGWVRDPDDILEERVRDERVDPLSLREELGGVVFGQENMVDGSRNLYAQPLGEFPVLDIEIRKLVLLADLTEQLGKAI